MAYRKRGVCGRLVQVATPSAARHDQNVKGAPKGAGRRELSASEATGGLPPSGLGNSTEGEAMTTVTGLRCDVDARKVFDQDGNEVSLDEARRIYEDGPAEGWVSLWLVRLAECDFDWDALDEYFGELDAGYGGQRS